MQATVITNQVQCDRIHCDQEEGLNPFPVDLKAGEDAVLLTEQEDIPVLIPSRESATGIETVMEAVTNSWKGVVRLVKRVFPESWVRKYEINFLNRNLLLETAGKVFTIDSHAPQWVPNELDPDGGAWAFLGYIEGGMQLYTIPEKCLEPQG